MCSGGYAGSGRALRLDPCGLPVRFSASDAAADGRVRDVELHRERVVVRRSLQGMRMALNMPVAAFAGISLRLKSDEDGDMLAVVLQHTDPSLTLPLFLTSQADEAVAEWRAWSEVLDVPLLLAEQGASASQCPSGTNSHRAPASAPPPPERVEEPPARHSSAAWIRQGWQADVDSPRRTRNHLAELARKRFAEEFGVSNRQIGYLNCPRDRRAICSVAASPSRRPAYSFRHDPGRLFATYKTCGRC